MCALGWIAAQNASVLYALLWFVAQNVSVPAAVAPQASAQAVQQVYQPIAPGLILLCLPGQNGS
jgi:hypothetical protein